MTGEYQPSNRAIIRQAYKNLVVDPLIKTRNGLRTARRFGLGVVSTAAMLTVAPHIIPTFARIVGNAKRKDPPSEISAKIPKDAFYRGLDVGVIIGIGSLCAQAIITGDSLTDSSYQLLGVIDPEYFLIPVATNVLSGSWEAGRWYVERVRQQLIEKNTANLEQIVQE